MQVYSVLERVAYEGDSLLGVFGSRQEAEQFARSQEFFEKSKGWGTSYGVVESELGASVSWEDFQEVE